MLKVKVKRTKRNELAEGWSHETFTFEGNDVKRTNVFIVLNSDIVFSLYSVGSYRALE